VGTTVKLTRNQVLFIICAPLMFCAGFIVAFVLFEVIDPLPSFYRITLINESPNPIEQIRLVTWEEGPSTAAKPAGEKFFFEKNLGNLAADKSIAINLESKEVSEGSLFVQAKQSGTTIEKQVFEYVTQSLDGVATVRFKTSGQIEVIQN
jgi:hypothetical protein